MRTHVGKSIVGVLFGALGGCGTAPELPDENRISMPSIIRQLRCEVYTATLDFKPEPRQRRKERRFSPALQDFVASLAIGYTITIQVKDTDGVNTQAASAAWGIPISLGMFTIKAAGGLNEVARRTGSYNATFLVSDVWNEGEAVCGGSNEGPSRLDLSGRFGVDTWLMRAIDTRSATPASDVFKTTGTTIEFLLTPSIGITPTWAILHPGGRKFDGTFPIGWQREFNNKLDIAITQNDSKPKITKVCIVNPSGECTYPPDVKGSPKREGGDFEDRRRGGITPDAQRRLDEQLNDLKIQGLRNLNFE